MYDLFNQSQPQATTAVKSGSNYSFETSLPAYKSNPGIKLTQAESILELVKELKETCLLELSDRLDIPQSTVSGRIKDLRDAGKVKYAPKEDSISYKGYVRKKICLCS